MYDRVADNPDVEGIWQGHLALTAEGHNTADDMIANFGESEDCEGHWLKASVQADGTFTMTNGRNGYSRTYTGPLTADAVSSDAGRRTNRRQGRCTETHRRV